MVVVTHINHRSNHNRKMWKKSKMWKKNKMRKKSKIRHEGSWIPLDFGSTTARSLELLQLQYNSTSSLHGRTTHRSNSPLKTIGSSSSSFTWRPELEHTFRECFDNKV